MIGTFRNKNECKISLLPFPFLQKTDFDRIILLDKDYNVDKMVIQERLKLLRICHSEIPYNRDETSKAGNQIVFQILVFGNKIRFIIMLLTIKC